MMTDKKVAEHFNKAEIQIPKEILKILKISEKQTEEVKYHTNEEEENYFEEWLKD